MNIQISVIAQDLQELDCSAEQLAEAVRACRGGELVIAVHSPGSIGPSPTVAVTRIGVGFDWNAGHVILAPAEPLTRLTPEQVQAIEKSVRMGSSWHAFQSYTKQANRIKELEAQVAALTQKLLQEG